MRTIEGKFGKFHQKGIRNWKYTDMFFKPHPDTVSLDHKIFSQTLVTFDTYQAQFNDVSTVTDTQQRVILQNHDHSELITDLLTQSASSSDNDD
jgi:hypothetical protein